MPQLYEPGATTSSEDDKKKKKKKKPDQQPRQQPDATRVIVPTARRQVAPVPRAPDTHAVGYRDLLHQSYVDQINATQQYQDDVAASQPIIPGQGSGHWEGVGRDRRWVADPGAQPIPEGVDTSAIPELQMRNAHQMNVLDRLPAHFINERLSYFSPAAIASAPEMVFRLAFGSKYRGVDMKKNGESVSDTLSFVYGKNDVGLEKGALAAARLYAIHTDNQEGLDFLDSVQNLPAPQQNAIIQFLRDPNPDVSTFLRMTTAGSDVSGNTGPVMPGWTAQELQALKTAYNHTLVDKWGFVQHLDDNGDPFFTIANTDASVQTMTAIKTLFPASAQLFSIAGPDGWDDIHTNPVRSTAMGINLGLRVATLPIALGVQGYKNILKNASELGARLGYGGLDNASDDNKIPPQLEAAAIKVAGIAGTPIDAFNKGFEILDTGVHAVIHSTVGALLNGDPETDQQIEDALSGMTEFFIIKRVGEFSKGAKMARTELPGSAEAMLDLTPGGLGVTDILRHPLAGTAELARYAGHEVAKFSTLEEAVHGSSITKHAFDAIEVIRKRYSGMESRIGAIRSLFGDRIPIELVKKLAASEREGMAGVFIDYANRAKELPVRTAEITARMKERQGLIRNASDSKLIEQRMNEIEKIYEQADAAVYDDLNVTHNPDGTTTVSGIHGTRGGDPLAVPADQQGFGGLHFGTSAAATERLGPGAGAEHIPIEATGKFLGSESPLSEVDNTLLAAGGLEEALMADLLMPEQLDSLTPELRTMAEEADAAGVTLTERLRQEGYDGYIYENEVEDAGSLSAAVFDPKTASRIGSPAELDAKAAELENKLIQDKNSVTQWELQQASDAYELNRLAGDMSGMPVYQYPKVQRVKRFLRGDYDGIVGTVGRSVLVEPMRKLGAYVAEELPNRPVIHSPDSAKKPLDWMETNVDNMDKYYRRAGVPEEEIYRSVGELANVKTRAEMYDWERSSEALLDRFLPEDTPTNVRYDITHWHQNPAEARGGKFYTEEYTNARGKTVRHDEPVVPKTDKLDPESAPVAMPSSFNDFVGRTVLPDINLLIDATSSMRRAMRLVAGTGMDGLHDFLSPETTYRRKFIGATNYGSAVGIVGAYHTMGAILKIGTSIFKAPILVLRLPAMALRIQMEQAFRAREFGGYKPMVLPGGIVIPADITGALSHGSLPVDYQVLGPGADYNRFTPPHEAELGGIHGQLAEDHVASSYAPIPMDLINLRKIRATGEHFTALVETLDRMHNDKISSQFAHLDFDPIEMRKYIESHSDYHDFVYDQQLPVLRESDLYREGMTDSELIDVWLEREGKSLNDVVGNSAALRQAVATGTYRPVEAGVGFGTDPISGKPVREHYAELTEEEGLIRARIDELQRELRQAPSAQLRLEVRTLADRGRSVRSKLSDLRRDYPAVESEAGRPIKLQSQAMANELQRLYDAPNSTFQFPNTLNVKRRYSWYEKKGIFEQAHELKTNVNNFIYKPFKLLQYADTKGTRGSLYLQMSDRITKGLEARGYEPAEAKALGQLRGATMTRDLMYDLAARTSLHRATEDIFWFAPAFQEAAYTYLFKIPGQHLGGPVVGTVLNVAKIKAAMNIFRGMGIIVPDNQGGERVMISGLAALIDHLLPGEQNFGQQISFDLKGLNLVTSNPVPGLATFPSAALGHLARDHAGVFRYMSNVFNQYGNDVQATPRQIIYLWEAVFGAPPPTEFLSPSYAKAQYDRAKDQAIQWAYSEEMADGNLPPRPEDFDTPEAYQDARDNYLALIMRESDQYFAGVAATRLAGATVTPSSLQVTEEEREKWNQFYAKFIDPLDNESGKYTEKQSQLIEDYLGNHPYALAYTIGYTQPGKKTKELAYAPTQDDDFFDKVYTGAAKIMDPDSYALKLMSVESYRFYVAQKDAALHEIGDTAPELLTHGFEKQGALAQFTEDWHRYLDYNPDAEAQLKKSRDTWARQYGIPANTYEVERVSTTIQLLNEMSGYFTGEGGVRESDYRRVLGELKMLYAEKADFGEPTTQIGKDLDWYYNEVLDPYFAQTEDLYKQANTLSAAGLDASAVYDQIREINNSKFGTLTHNGVAFPSPEETFFGNKNGDEQKYAVLNWATKPPQWLSTFQGETVNALPDFEGQSDMLQELSDFDVKEFDKYVTDNKISTSSSYYDTLLQWKAERHAAIAAEYGTEGTEALKLIDGTPLDRLNATPEFGGSDNPAWVEISGNVQEVIANIQSSGDSIKGYGPTALQQKTWLYTTIEAKRKTDSDYNQLWVDLSRSIPEAGMDTREGIPLYEAVLFGNFATDYIPDSLLYLHSPGDY